MSKLHNRVALITGGGRGIGRAIALAFAAAGARVVVTARTAEELDEVVRTIRSAKGHAEALVGDLSDPDGPLKLLAQAKVKSGPVEILVNNAGIGSSANPKPVVDFDDEFWDLSVRVNLTAPYRLCKGVLPDMLAR